MFPVIRVDAYVGKQMAYQPVPKGNEVFLCAGLSALNYSCNKFLWGRKKYREDLYEHYIAVPFLFVNYGEEKNPRKAALLGHALFHGAKDKCMTDVREYSAKEACLVEPILRVQGRGEQWFSFRGKLITNVACLLVRDELARRVLM